MLIFNKSYFKTNPETSEQEPEGTEEPLNNVQIEVENDEESEQENTQREKLQPVA